MAKIKRISTEVESDYSFKCKVIALDARISMIVNSNRISKKTHEYLQYHRKTTIHHRINNRSYLCDSFDGAFVLSYKYKRRRVESKPHDFRPFYGICMYDDFPFK